jgi:molecular chaperone GrpE
MSDDVRDDVDFESEEEMGSSAALKVKLAKIKEEFEAVKKERAEFLDGWQRCKAESVNSRREAEEARVRAAHSGRENFILDLLPALDSFDMAMQGEAWQKVDATWRSGVESIRSQIEKVLKDNDVEAFGAPGDVFDPALHEPIKESSGGVSHTVEHVYRRGYRTKTRTLRPAQVSVFS